MYTHNLIKFWWERKLKYRSLTTKLEFIGLFKCYSNYAHWLVQKKQWLHDNDGNGRTEIYQENLQTSQYNKHYT